MGNVFAALGQFCARIFRGFISLCKHEKVLGILKFLFFLALYGAAINFALAMFLIVPLNIYIAIACGLLFHFIKFEIPEIIKSITINLSIKT